MKPMQAVCRRHNELLNVKAGGTFTTALSIEAVTQRFGIHAMQTYFLNIYKKIILDDKRTKTIFSLFFKQHKIESKKDKRLKPWLDL